MIQGVSGVGSRYGVQVFRGQSVGNRGKSYKDYNFNPYKQQNDTQAQRGHLQLPCEVIRHLPLPSLLDFAC